MGGSHTLTEMHTQTKRMEQIHTRAMTQIFHVPPNNTWGFYFDTLKKSVAVVSVCVSEASLCYLLGISVVERTLRVTQAPSVS